MYITRRRFVLTSMTMLAAPKHGWSASPPSASAAGGLEDLEAEAPDAPEADDEAPPEPTEADAPE